MGALSIWHILILAVIVLLLFGGRGKISDLMGDVAKGIKQLPQGPERSGRRQDRPPPRRSAPTTEEGLIGAKRAVRRHARL